MRLWKKITCIVGGILGFAGIGLAAYVWKQTSAFDESMARVYDIPPSDLRAVQSAMTIDRGRHLAKTLGSCALSECHGSDLAGGTTIELGPLGAVTGPNITGSALGAAYSDDELVRLIRHGVKKDGTSVIFMPSHEFNWLPDDDLVALLSYLRSVPDVARSNGVVRVGLLGKILDRRGEIIFDVARRIDHEHIERAPAPTPTQDYGKYIGRFCTGCHGEAFSGGPIPGAPPSIPIPTNITPHESGLQSWSYQDFVRLLDSGIKKDGKKLDPFMPLSALTDMNDVERRALWEFLRSLPGRPSGNR